MEKIIQIEVAINNKLVHTRILKKGFPDDIVAAKLETIKVLQNLINLQAEDLKKMGYIQKDNLKEEDKQKDADR